MVEQKGGDYINREADALRLSFATTKALRSFPCWPFWTSSDLGPWRTLMLNCRSKIKNDARTDAKKFTEALSLVDCMENMRSRSRPYARYAHRGQLGRAEQTWTSRALRR